MPILRIKIGNETFEGPSEKIPELKRLHPEAQVLGLANAGSVAKSAGMQGMKQMLAESPMAKTAGMVTGAGRKLQQFADDLPLGPLTAPVKAAAFMAPKSNVELGLMAVGGAAAGPIESGVTQYVKRIAPGLVDVLFGNVAGKAGAEALARNPGKVAQIANMGKEGAARAETAAVNKVRAGVAQVWRDAKKRLGQMKNRILAVSGNPSIDPAPIQRATTKAMSDFNFLPELRTAQVADARAASAFRAVDDDILEFVTRPKGISVSELMRFRENLNRLLRSQISDTLKGGLSAIKSSLDDSLLSALGDDLMQKYGKANAAFANVASKYGNIQKLVIKKGAGPRVSKAVEEGTEIGQELRDFLKDASVLDELTDTVAARRFSGDVFRNMQSGSTGRGAIQSTVQSATFVPGAGMAGRAGLPVTPQGVANFAANVAKTKPAIRYGSPFAARESSRFFGGRDGRSE